MSGRRWGSTIPDVSATVPASAANATLNDAQHPIARLYGAPLAELPEDLYIPPQALRLLLEAFEGPFDLLWFLIRKNQIDLRDIPVAKLTEQYLEYVAAMKALDLDLAAEYLAMAATLIALKARLLLPRTEERAASEDEAEDDPRARLVAQLVRYEQYRQVAEILDRLPRAGRDFFWSQPVEVAEPLEPPPLPAPALQALARAWWSLLARQERRRPHEVVEEPLTVTVVSQALLETLRLAGKPLTLPELLPQAAGRRYLVTAFFALLELARLGAVDLTQDEPLAPIVVTLGKAPDEACGKVAVEIGAHGGE